MLHIISNASRKITPEIEIFRAILDWVEHSPDERKQHLSSLIKKLDLELILHDSPEQLEEKFRDGTILSKDPECSKIFHKLCVRVAVEASISKKLANEVREAPITCNKISQTCSAWNPTSSTTTEPEAITISEQNSELLDSLENNDDAEAGPLPNSEDPEPENSPGTGSLSPGYTNFPSSSSATGSLGSNGSDEEVIEDDDDEYTPTSRIIKIVAAPSTCKEPCIQLTRPDANNTHHYDLRKTVKKRGRDKSPIPEQNMNENGNKGVNEPKCGKLLKLHVGSNEEIEPEEKFVYPRYMKTHHKSRSVKVLELYDFNVSKKIDGWIN